MLKHFSISPEILRTHKKSVLIGFGLFIIVMNLYVFSKYRIGDVQIKSINLTTNTNALNLSLYMLPEHAHNVDFSRPVKATLSNGRCVFNLPAATRNFRIYFETANDQMILENLSLGYANHVKPVDFSGTALSNLFVTGRMTPSTLTVSNLANGYIELKYQIITVQELIWVQVLILAAALLLSYLTVLTFYAYFEKAGKYFDLKSAAASCFFASIFLPHPLFNLAFILSFVLILPGFQLKKFVASRTGLLILLYFIVFMFNNLLVSEAYNGTFTETMLPFLFLPFYFACLPKANYFNIFILTAFLMSLYLIAGSATDLLIFREPGVFSFEAFSKHLHPVYFSYLLFFAICLLVLLDVQGIHKKPALTVLLLALICSGSKLIISLTMVFFAFRFLRKKARIALPAIALMVISVLIFKPTRDRFSEIFNLHNLTILSDHPLQSIHDTRLNGLTLRLILWQESLEANDNIRTLLFGRGVDKQADLLLEKKLTARGLESGHAKYDPHNQFIATFYKMGLLGLSVLLACCTWIFILAWKRRSQLIFYCGLLFTLAMFTESVLQRVLGIYFFICILLLLSDPITNTALHFENSNTGNKRNS